MRTGANRFARPSGEHVPEQLDRMQLSMPATADKDRLPVALTIAGSDSSGGAGIQADLKTFAALGVYGSSVLTALTAQNTTCVQAVHVVPADFVDAQIDSVLSDLDVRALKTGMLANGEIIEVVAARFKVHPHIHSVVDPVMVATSGDPLIAPDAIEAVRNALVPAACLITPNLNEAAALLDADVATSYVDVERQAHSLKALGCRSVLVKGGHLDGGDGKARDYYLSQDIAIWLEAEQIETRNTHGTGCTLSAAIAAYIVRGHDEASAVARAKRYLTAALRLGRDVRIGAGSGPVDHHGAGAAEEGNA